MDYMFLTQDEIHVHKAFGPVGLVNGQVKEALTTYFKHTPSETDSTDFLYGSLGIGAKAKRNFFRHQ
eukprot:5087183-Pyramimonas_sp.AAC.2